MKSKITALEFSNIIDRDAKIRALKTEQHELRGHIRRCEQLAEANDENGDISRADDWRNNARQFKVCEKVVSNQIDFRVNTLRQKHC